VLASAAFVVLIVGVTYFGILVYASHFAEGAERAAAYRELGMFLSGQLEWYRDARVYGAVSLLLALASVLCGVHPLARITLPVAGAAYVVLQFFGDHIRDLLHRWATM
jgi:hypothetical protein